MSLSAFVDALRAGYGPRARVKRIHRAGLEGVQVLDDDGRILAQTFEYSRPIDLLRCVMGER